MLKNYLKIALRNLFKYKVYSIINIFGLSVGLACCILIMLFIRDELNYDKFHKNADQIYRVVVEFKYRDRPDHFAQTQAPLAPALLNEFPEVLNAVRFARRSEELIASKEKYFWEKGLMLADPSIFEVFTFPLIKGDSKTALNDPNSIVITQRMAQKYFSDEDPIGKILKIGDEGVKDYKVTGILKNIPSNSQLQFDFLISFENQKGNIGWGQWNYSTYIQLPPNYPAHELEKRLPDLVGKYMGEETRAGSTLHLQPLIRIHLHSNLRDDLPTNRDLSHLYIFSGIALLIMMLACINFVNLVTARSTVREKEVGLRKVVGANRLQLILQFLGEAILLSFFSFLLSFVFVEILLPVFNTISGKEMAFHLIHDFPFMITLIGLMFIVGILSGSYPAFVISRFQPVSILRKGFGEKTSVHPSTSRKFLVVAQFAISIMFLFSTALMHQQLRYIRNKNLGYDKEHLVVLPIFYRDVQPKCELLKSEIMQSPLIVNATKTSYLPSRLANYQNLWWEGLPDNNEYMHWIGVDHDFIQTLGLRIKSGRDFSREYPTDQRGAYILNEAAVEMTGWESPIGKQFEIVDRGEVIGIIHNFHFQSLHQKIQPLVLYIYPESFRYMLVRIRAEDIPKSLQFLKQKWEELFPGRLFEFSFFDEDFDRIYMTETRLAKTFNYITCLAILIACLGLFGLASFTTLRRTKEIGIRKVLGASVSGIIILLSKDFLKWVLVANLIAWPLSYFAMNKWLQNFAYRTDIGLSIFLLAAVLVFAIALLTIIFQAIKAALANPVDSLRYE
jgi:putative ABC transport system permease protein